ncbi:tyrosine recombinase XerC [Corynebacterium sp.]|uniref:site-specific integrase n=1 Tax=Corynebacterium sp. TaxID=1720 RepID=UPI003735B943
MSTPRGIRSLSPTKYEATYHQPPSYRPKTKTFPTLEKAIAFRKDNNQLPAGVRELPSGKYQGRYKGPDGKPYSKTLDSALKAAAWVADEKARIALGPDVWRAPTQRERDRVRKQLTVADFLATYIDAQAANGLSDTTLQRYQRSIRTRITQITETIDTATRITEAERLRRREAAGPATALATTALVELTRGDAHDWWGSIQATYPDTKVANYQTYQLLRAAMTDAVRRELIEVNVVDIPSAARRPKADQTKKILPTAQEITDIIAATADNYRLAVALCLRAGLRRGEALGIYTDNLVAVPEPGTDAVTYQLTIAQQVKRLEPEDGKVQVIIGALKTEASARTIPLPSDLNEIIETHLAKFVRPARLQPTQWGDRHVQLVTTTKNGTPTSPSSFGEHFKKWVKAAGANPALHLHSGRYDVNTRLAENGVTPKAIGAYLGEKDLSVVVEIYQQVRDKQINALGNLLND